MKEMRSVKSRILFLLVIAIMLRTSVVLADDSNTVKQGDLGGLQSQLEQLGWKVEHSASGDLLLWPPGHVAAEQPQRVKADEKERIQATDLDSLQRKLREKGWQVSRDQDGALLLYPSGPSVAAESSDTQEQEADRLDDLRALLTASGWKVEKQAQGDLLLYPGSSGTTAKPGTGTLKIEQTNVVGVKNALDKAGWRTEQREDGSLILYPRADGAQKTEDPVAAGKVTLPVDTWKEARRIARYWIKQQGDDTLSMGKIRKVNWIYLVSIVDKHPPYELKNQLVIRSGDGSVVPIY